MSPEKIEQLGSNKEEFAIPEYNFENGVDWSINRITELLENRPCVVVAFTGSSTEGGKNTLSIRILNKVYE